MRRALLGLVVVAVLAAGAFFGWQRYQDAQIHAALSPLVGQAADQVGAALSEKVRSRQSLADLDRQIAVLDEMALKDPGRGEQMREVQAFLRAARDVLVDSAESAKLVGIFLTARADAKRQHAQLADPWDGPTRFKIARLGNEANDAVRGALRQTIKSTQAYAKLQEKMAPTYPEAAQHAEMVRESIAEMTDMITLVASLPSP